LLLFLRWSGVVAGSVIATAVTAAAPPVVPPPLALPVAAPCISSPFGPRRLVGPHAATFHNGIDLPAPAGAWVHAVAAGEVVQIRRLGGFGLEVDVLHHDARGRPFISRYAHLGSVAPALANGRRRVGRGEAIARVGLSGIIYGTHLFFEMLVGGKPIDPAPFFPLARCGQPGAQRAALGAP
jgi:murein DD-endopeptidase MepM/ murein hydrolase activator NlpD